MDNSLGSSLKLAINIINANDDVKDSLNDGNVKTIKTNNGLAFAYDPDLYDTYDDLADDTLPTLKLGIINLDDSEYYDQPKLTHALAEYMGAENDDDIDLSILPDFSDFVDENKESIDKAIESIDKKYYDSMNTIDPSEDDESDEPQRQTDEVKDNTIYDPASATFSSDNVENVIPAEEPKAVNAAAQPTTEETTIPDYSNGNNGSLDIENGPTAKHSKKLPDSLSLSNEENNEAVTPKTPKWFDLAREMFGEADQAELSMYDPNTHKQLQSQIVKVEQNIAKGQGKGVRRIYSRIMSELPEMEKAFEADFKKNADKHADTLKTIEANEKDDIDRVTKAHTEKYNAGKERYVESKREPLEEEYDAANKDAFTKALSAAVNGIRANSEALRHQEEKKFNDFKAEEKDKYIENQIRTNVNIDDIIADFNKLVETDNDWLKNEASKFGDQVAVVTQTVVEKLRKAQADSKKYENAYNTLKETYNKKVDAEASTRTKQNVTVLHGELASKNRDLNSALAENETIKKALADEQKKNRDLNAVAEQYKAQVELYKNHPVQNSQPIMNPQMPQPQFQAIPQQSQQSAPQQQIDSNSIPAREAQKEISQKKHKGGTIVGIIVAMLAVAGLSVGGTAMALGHDQNQVRTEQSVSSSSDSQPHVESDNKTTQYKAGDTWTYYNKDDQKNYTVTMDNGSMGHYTDKNGQQHSITLKNNN